MKKLVFMFVALAAISLSSCGGRTETPTDVNDSDSISVMADSVDSVAMDSVFC